MEEYTNKYMQVFDTYDEFAQNSADYVKGEDHIAYLIQENEVIYWLYLEQVWRPLNVRTTKTGELEDGRTKVAVRLEYVEGGQKYTSVPNIPDPERITSMSHFLEDYPDIEEVNVTGTVNLTDLSYAFAGSKIKDFSLLDTSNVTNYVSCLENVNLNNGITINIGNVQELGITELFKNSTITNAIINIPNNVYIKGSTPLYNTTFNTFEIPYDENDIEVNESDTYLTWGDGINKYKTVSIRASKGNKVKAPSLFLYFNDVSEHSNINIQEIECVNAYFESGQDVKNIKIKAKKLIYGADGSEELEGKIDNREVECTCITKEQWNYIPTVSFGYGFYKNPDRLTGIINNNGTLGNFFYTVPVVDDAFYADKQCPISIFQYKTTFTEVADVNITEATDNSLIYVDWGSIDFDKSNVNVEIYNVIDAITFDRTKHFNKFIIDNSNIEINGINNYPRLNTQHNGADVDLNYNKYRISGNYQLDYNIYNSLSFKDINIYCNNKTVYCYTSEHNFSNDKNIKLYNVKNINLLPNINTDNFIIETLIENNIFNSYCQLYNWTYSQYRKNRLLIQYIDNVKLNIYAGMLTIYYKWFEHTSENNYIDIYTDTNLVYGELVSMKDDWYLDTLENVYVNCINDTYINYFDGFTVNTTGDDIPFTMAKNWHGVINIILSSYRTDIDYNIYTNYTEHIDINLVKPSNSSNNSSVILGYKYLDDESTINLITKLVDNTSNSTNTIYMYRSQANVIGDDNIAAAVAKNYEFAIIEN